jgi:hypothetical protein
MSSKTVADKLDKLAKVLLDDALSAQPMPGTNRLDVFKAVSQYHIGSTRAAKGQPEEEAEGSSFQELRKSLQSIGTERSN